MLNSFKNIASAILRVVKKPKAVKLKTVTIPLAKLGVPDLPPYTIRVSVPIKNMSNNEFYGLREEFVIESEDLQISYSKVLDAICHIDEDDDNNWQCWRIENAMDTVINLTGKEREFLNKTLAHSNYRLPVELNCCGQIAKTYIEITVDQK